MRVWWYHALTAADTTGGQQMGPATNGGTGRVSCAGQLNFCEHTREGNNSKEMIH